MLDPIVAFVTGIFQWIGYGIGLLIGAILWPFFWLGRWYIQRGWLLKLVVGVLVVGLAGLYGYFFWTTQRWTNFNPDYVNAYRFEPQPKGAAAADVGTDAADSAAPAADANAAPAASGAAAPATTTGVSAATCRRSAIVDVTADLVDFDVDQNAWVSSMILYKAGFFGLSWDSTPFFDNKASFQRGTMKAVKRTSVELYDTLGRVRGTSAADSDLERARGSLQYRDDVWYITTAGGYIPRPIAATPSSYRDGAAALRSFNTRLSKCGAQFDARADNLVTFLDRIAKDIGSTTAQLKDRAENYNRGWFDTRADNLYWDAYGELYGYYGILKAAHADFADVIAGRQLTGVWNEMEGQIRSALRIQPMIVSNGKEDGWVMPTHLTTMGFYILRVRTNLTEIRDVLQR